VRSVTIHLRTRAEDVERWSRGEVSGKVIKENHGRTVWRVPSGSPALYVKRFPAQFFRDRARQEAEMLKALEAASIPCPRLVALARDEKGSYIVTEEIADAGELRERLSQGGTGARTLLSRLGRLAKELHDAGIEHLDFHVGNVMVRGETLFVLDVHRARRKKLSRDRRLDGAAFTAMSFLDFVPTTDVVRFFRAYGLRTHEEIEDVCRRLHHRRQLYFRGRDERCLREGTGFEVRGGVYLRRGVDLDALQKEIRAGGTTIKKHGPETLVRLAGDRFVKHVPRNRALKIWKNGHALLVRGLPTPKLLACGKDWVAGEWIDGTNLGDVARDAWAGMNRAQRDDVLFRLARLTRRMHDLGVFHKDLKSANVILKNGSIHLVDLDRVSFGGLSRKEATFNLAQLNASVAPSVTRADRLRFLRVYIGRDRGLLQKRKSWIRQLMEATRARRHLWPPR
jgi:tRNA A-37 threonylcarbamoyl transferase component Bud32